MYDFIASLLGWLYDLWPSYGGSIILLTLVIMTVMAPVTIRQTKSMMAMQRLQPEIKKLRVKYGDDRERLNQEMMALYQANNVNPLGGCLPILIQMPIFLVLFQVVRGLTRRVSAVGLATGERSFSDSGQIVEFADRTFNPNYLSENSALYQNLTHDTEMRSFGLDLSESASQALGESIWHGLPYLLLVIAVGVTTWLQQKQIAGRQSGAEVNPQQQMIMKVLPFMLPIFSFGFPAALVVYWFVSNLFRVGQQMFITKQVYGKDSGDAVVVPAATESKSKSTKSNANQTARKGSSKTSGGKHGSRSPVSGPAPKKKPKPKAQSASAKKRSTPESKQRQERTTSKRVTPKKASAPEPTTSTRRRDRKKK